MSKEKKAAKYGRNRDSGQNANYKLGKRAEVNAKKRQTRHIKRMTDQAVLAAPDYLKGRARAIRRIQQGVTAPQDVGHVCTRHGITPAEANGKPAQAPHHVVYPWKAQLTKEWYAR